MTPFACGICLMPPRGGHGLHTGAEPRADLDSDRQLVLSLVKEVEIIGEAAYQLSQEARDSLPEIPWEDIIGMRHRVTTARRGCLTW